MHKSIIHDLDGDTCFICGRHGAMEKHHCWHGSNRKWADRDGLIVNLCRDCHRALHDHGTMDKELMGVAESRWLDYYGRSTGEFIGRYGKNVL